MPLSLHAGELQPGMRLAESIIHDGRLMLPGGRSLTPADIESIRRRFPNIIVRIGDPLLDNLVDFEDDSHEREIATTTRQRIVETMRGVHRRFGDRTELASINFPAMQQSVNEVIDYLDHHPVSAALISHGLNRDGYLSEHVGNVFYLVMVLGSAVRDYVAEQRQQHTAARRLSNAVALDLTPLGLGAMFMDLGLYPHEQLFRHPLRLSPEERELVRDHAAASADLLPENFNATARMVVRTHHETCDGCGYPDGLPIDRQHVFTRIVRIADAYDALTAEHIFAEALSPARALWEMSVGRYRRCYDPILMKVFASLIQPFPIGAMVELDDGRHGVVVRYNRSRPFYPMIVIAFDEWRRRLPQDQLEGPVRLEERLDLRLRSFRGEDLSFIDNDVAEPSGDAPDGQPNSRSIDSLFDAAVP
jgi:HD-GYP domain-containing protein (c-di-GMP phosphodiesterase class II)